MGFFDDMKKVFVPQDEDYEEETLVEEEDVVEEEKPRRETATRLFQTDKKKVVSYNQSLAQMQVVLCKPERFDDVPSVADHLNDKKTVVLNLEAANRETSRRIIDFLSGVAYANHGNIKKIANSTYIVTPNDVNVMGELMLDDFESGNIYF
ncbi:MAG: cell division protein SepF [Clostridia bacterium]|nr:cell division protein SepF [Clostridia bacterium]MBQ2274638.1 cell division protein SepF [Clostridia bacterium]MEE1278312.1 cell division protein SepF [Acutalibacteraceae bacterium]